jgi:putative ABC transport system permease protein
MTVRVAAAAGGEALQAFTLTSFDVTLRRYELGIRASLGASAATLRRTVILDAVRPVVMGTVIGLIASYWISQWVQALVYQIDARDPATFAVVPLTLLMTSAAAAWLPARRAARVNPADVLRAR